MPANSPQEIDTLFEKAMKGGDLDAVMELYEPAAVFPWPQDELYKGAEAIRKLWEPIVASKPQNEFEIKKVLIADDIAVIYKSWKSTRPVEVSATAVEVSRRQADGTWRLVIDDSFAFGAE